MNESTEESLKHAFDQYPELAVPHERAVGVAGQVRSRRRRVAVTQASIAVVAVAASAGLVWNLWGTGQADQVDQITPAPNPTIVPTTETAVKLLREAEFEYDLTAWPEVKPAYDKLMTQCYAKYGEVYGETPQTVDYKIDQQAGPRPAYSASVQEWLAYNKRVRALQLVNQLGPDDVQTSKADSPNVTSKSNFHRAPISSGGTLGITIAGCDFESKKQLFGGKEAAIAAAVLSYELSQLELNAKLGDQRIQERKKSQQIEKECFEELGARGGGVSITDRIAMGELEECAIRKGANELRYRGYQLRSQSIPRILAANPELAAQWEALKTKTFAAANEIAAGN